MSVEEKLSLGFRHHQAGDLIQAEQAYREVLSSSPDQAQALFLLGTICHAQGRLAEAESIVKADRPAEEAAANVADLKRLLSRKGNARADAGKLPVAAAGRPD